MQTKKKPKKKTAENTSKPSPLFVETALVEKTPL